jgi:catechol 2,3-dioxygenase-like lactoylglutathione lyase family enzyme
VSFIATIEPKAAEAFYSSVLGLSVIERTPYAIVFADGENTLRVQIVSELLPASHTVHGWQVTNIENEIEGLASMGVRFLTFQHLEQSSGGVWITPDGHKIAWFEDPSGNILSLTQYK